MSGRLRGQRGAATVYAAVAGLMLAMVAMVALQVVAVVRLRHVAAAAADLAALAATQASVAGHEPCAAARAVARRDGARVLRCRMDVDVATVTVEASARLFWGQRWTSRRVARAAPADYLS